MAVSGKWSVPTQGEKFSQIPTQVSSSSLCRRRILTEWWLTKPESEGLKVSGIASAGTGEGRLFCSAKICKRITATVLEDEDGISITLTGLMNIDRSRNSGFSNTFCQHFKLGFPRDWQEYSDQRCHSETDPCLLSSTALESYTPVEIRRLLMELPAESESSMVDLLLGELKQITSPQGSVPSESQDCKTVNQHPNRDGLLAKAKTVNVEQCVASRRVTRSMKKNVSSELYREL